ncbi:hypothetical protein BQ8482_220024 [Mesorhizobium delmotii]|uniref:Uncharacterized protein n=1 Tax=Mesorhizobium delmotii TaxID=1631247 RepID=A0A2P9AL28_9HYPH|nr:hypothetical protein BQ8482_220024 [Mesorhizobium delmotii]
MNLTHYDLRQRRRGHIIGITLTSGAIARLLALSSYRHGQRHQSIAKRSPVRHATAAHLLARRVDIHSMTSRKGSHPPALRYLQIASLFERAQGRRDVVPTQGVGLLYDVLHSQRVRPLASLPTVCPAVRAVAALRCL